MAKITMTPLKKRIMRLMWRVTTESAHGIEQRMRVQVVQSFCSGSRLMVEASSSGFEAGAVYAGGCVSMPGWRVSIGIEEAGFTAGLPDVECVACVEAILCPRVEVEQKLTCRSEPELSYIPPHSSKAQQACNGQTVGQD